MELRARRSFKIKANEKAKALSKYLPQNTTASYLYENGKGQRFYVLAFNALKSEDELYLLNYYRQKHIITAVKWLCGKDLPVVCAKNPRLYTICAENNGKMAVALFNIETDEILKPVIKLDKAYKSVSFINCEGSLDGDTVTLSEIPPYGFCAFETE